MSKLNKDLKEILSNEINLSVEVNGEESDKINRVELSTDMIDSVVENVELKEPQKKELKKEGTLFDREWTKLEKGMKLNRINLFIKKQKEENGLNDIQTKSLKDILFKACNDGMLNKMCDVSYKEEEIQSIRNLEFNEQTKKYKLKTSSSKHRVNVKSRSNIDRFMKK